MKVEPLTKLELQIYNAMKNNVRAQKHFTFSTLYSAAFEEFQNKYTRQEIDTAIKGLIQKRYFIEGSTLTIKDVIESPIRKQIIGFIQRNPGAYNRLIRRELNIGSNEFSWHMGMLLKYGIVKKLKFSQRNAGYFENKSFMGHEYDLFLLQKPYTDTILEFLRKTPSTISSLSRELGLHYNTTTKYISILRERGLLLPDSSERHEQFVPNELLLVKLKKIINGQVFVEFA